LKTCKRNGLRWIFWRNRIWKS